MCREASDASHKAATSDILILASRNTGAENINQGPSDAIVSWLIKMAADTAMLDG